MEPPPPPPPSGPAGSGAPSLPPPPPPPSAGSPPWSRSRGAPGIATAALVCGITGLVLMFLAVPSITAVVLGLVAARSIKRQPHGARAGLGQARAGWILGVLGLVGFAGFVVAVVATAGDGGEASTAGEQTSVFSLDVGDCVEVDDPAFASEDEIERLPERDCDRPHGGEVFVVDDVEGDGDYPGTDELAEQVRELCSGDAFESYVGSTYRESELDVYYLFPMERTWRFGDREYICIAAPLDGSTLTETVRDSGR